MSQTPPRLRSAAWFAGLCILFSGMALQAQIPGTMHGQILDENGEPVAGVKLSLTDPESPDFSQVEESNQKGRYRLFVANAIKTYTLKISKDGHQEVTLNSFKVPAQQRTRRNFTIRTAAAAQASAGTPQASAAGSGAAALYNQAVTAIQVEDLDSAESLLLQALEEDADLHNASAALAKIYLSREDHTKAIQYAQVAAAADFDVDAMNQVLYASYDATGEKKKAEAILANMQTADPKKASANLFNQAADLYNQGDTASAKPILEQVLSFDADHAKANYMLGLIYVGEQVNDKARTHLEKFIEVAPNDPDAALAKEMLGYLN